MSGYLATASLLLFSESPEWLPAEATAFAHQLSELGLAGEPMDTDHYTAGDRFFDHIAFMGCAPNIRFAAEPDKEEFSHLRIHTYEHITAMVGEHTRAPNCPQCRAAFDYKKTMLDTLDSDSRWQCPQCQHTDAPWQYHWRKGAGFARVFIEITDIYPKEAIPQTALLEALRDATGTAWRYCYLF